MEKPILICLFGQKGAGKDTCANIIKSYLQLKLQLNNTKTISFASPLKDMVSTLFSYPRHLVEGASMESREWREKPDEMWSKIQKTSFTPRKILQELGTLIKTYDPNFWVKLTTINIQKEMKNDSESVCFIITDGRFKNEGDEITGYLKNDFKILKIFINNINTLTFASDSYKSALNIVKNTNSYEKFSDLKNPILPVDQHISEWESVWLSIHEPKFYDAILQNDGCNMQFFVQNTITLLESLIIL